MNRTYFSCPHPLRGAGPSRPLTVIHEALAAWAGREYRVLEPAEFPQLTELNRLGDAIGPAFDDLATSALEGDGDPRVFVGGGGASLRQMQAVHRRGNAKAGTLWFSSHWEHAQRVLKEEYQHFGVQPSPIHPYVAWRAEQEQAESDFIIVPSQKCAETYTRPDLKVRVAEFGVDATAFRPPEKPRPDVGPLRVLMPATNPIRKGLRYVLGAVKSLPEEKFQFTITGGWRMPQEGAPAFGLSWGPPIVSTGWVNDEEMRRLMQEHHVLLLPSLEEGQALASLEAAASGMALVLTPEVGLPIKDGREGVLVAPRSAAGITMALLELEKDRAAVTRMGLAARAFAEQRPWSKFGERIVDILKTEGVA